MGRIFGRGFPIRPRRREGRRIAPAGGDTGQPKIKLAGTFTAKPAKVKLAGTFATKPVKVKVGGAFQTVP